MSLHQFRKTNARLPKFLSAKIVFTSFILINIGLFALLIYDLNRSVDDLSSSFIRETNIEVKEIVQDYIFDVQRLVQVTANHNYPQASDILNVEDNNKYFAPILSYLETVTTIVVASTEGTSYMIHKMEDRWVNRITKINDDQYTRTFLIEKNNTIVRDSMTCSVEDTIVFDPRLRPWYKGVKTMKPNEVFWTKPYIFYTAQKPGFTASTYSLASNGDTIVSAYDILLKDFNKITKSIELTPNGYAFIITADDFNLVGFPDKKQFDEEDSIAKYTLGSIKSLGIESLDKGIYNWIERDHTEEPFEIDVDHKDWWVGFQPVLSDEKEKLFYVVMMVPEADFRSTINRSIHIIIGSFIIILALIVFTIRAYRRIQTQNVKLRKKRIRIAKQKEAIQTKNKEIMDSIYYTKTIQTSMLPSKDELSSSFSDHFVLYLPKDIVSGDFYWVNQHDNYQMIAAVDCTGHGVPGAVLSMIGFGGLNSAINERHLVKPNEIMEHLQHVINSYFSKTNNYSINDGMDIALCVFNKEESVLHYAGAKNPIYIVRNSGNRLLVNGKEHEPELLEQDRALYIIKADRKGLEPSELLSSFKCNNIETEKDDLVYLFSDGYADQFGGDKGKKLNIRRFKELIYRVSKENPMAVQDKKLQEYFMQWKGREEQVDDVLVMGFRI